MKGLKGLLEYKKRKKEKKSHHITKCTNMIWEWDYMMNDD